MSGSNEVYEANWIGGCIDEWNYRNQNMFVILICLNNSKNVIDEIKSFINKIRAFHEVYGITQNTETKNYMVVFNNKYKQYNHICNAMHFLQNFGNWTSGDSDIDNFIQNSQLSDHSYYKCNALEWIPYNKLHKIAEVNIANWIDGYIYIWDN
ncbi:hypothetical protein RirG_002410 [Rhizophagus irregularis DAOM 197198w]|nr:hypothetical protein RirG_002410 [Rhizophagus irregularis DAOM 197198w]